MSAWQSIDTAPKDGSTFLTYAPAAKGVNGVAPARFGMARWNFHYPDKPRWEALGDWDQRLRVDACTHWMPMPNGPP